jgi:hypothetical protein
MATITKRWVGGKGVVEGGGVLLLLHLLTDIFGNLCKYRFLGRHVGTCVFFLLLIWVCCVFFLFFFM